MERYRCVEPLWLLQMLIAMKSSGVQCQRERGPDSGSITYHHGFLWPLFLFFSVVWHEFKPLNHSLLNHKRSSVDSFLLSFPLIWPEWHNLWGFSHFAPRFIITCEKLVAILYSSTGGTKCIFKIPRIPKSLGLHLERRINKQINKRIDLMIKVLRFSMLIY